MNAIESCFGDIGSHSQLCLMCAVLLSTYKVHLSVLIEIQISIFYFLVTVSFSNHFVSVKNLCVFSFNSINLS